MPSLSGESRPQGNVRARVLMVAVAAVVMGLPTLSGSFVGGDDHRLLLHHVLVNHPSIEHALKLFTIFHRDLYQPLPLLSFQVEFAIARGLGLFDEGVAEGARLFHLTNILLHTVNAVLVWFVVRMLCQAVARGPDAETNGGDPSAPAGRSDAIATGAALLFAIHPLQTEVVAWTNGRMMLLSTLFALASLLTFAAWLHQPRLRTAALVVALVLLCSISKVRIGLPVLLAVVLLARCEPIRPRVVGLWLACAAVTAVFVLVNVRATSGASLFEEAAEHLQGPRLARVALALDNYIRHMVWPAGLASYYPTPPRVRWTDPATLSALAVTVPALLGVAWACLRSRVALLGTIWFGATTAATLPFLPARNVLAADRYMYLPIVGAAWIAATAGHALYRRCSAGWSPGGAKRMLWAVGTVIAAALIAACWHVAGFYSTPYRKASRIANLFPDTPRVWEPVGWLHYRDGRYDDAIAAAELELRHDAPSVRSGALQLIGMCEFQRGNVEAALDRLRTALEINPDSTLGRYRLARAYEDLGEDERALPLLEAAVAQAPGHNPTIHRLARLYQRLGRITDARAAYEKQIDNNPYDVPGAMGLVELDLAEGTADSFARAEARLGELLAWMPENSEALTNLGAALVGLGREPEAVRAYEEALRNAPRCVPAALNLANLKRAAGDANGARRLYAQAVEAGLASVHEALAVHDFLVSQGDLPGSVSLWREFVGRFPGSTEGRAWLGWSLALAGMRDEAGALAKQVASESRSLPPVQATLAYLGLLAEDHEAAARGVEALCAAGEDRAMMRRRMLAALERFDQIRPGTAWTYCLVARLVMADGNEPALRAALAQCEALCTREDCRTYAAGLRERMKR